MKSRIFIATLVAPALLVSCSERNAPTAANEMLTNPALNFMSGPDNPGRSGVLRFQDMWLVGTTDPERDLLAYHFQSDDWVGCGGSSTVDDSDIQVVIHPKEALEAFKLLGQAGEIPVVIYRLSDPEPDFCKFLNENWLYRGSHSITVHNSDYTLDAPGASSFGWSAHGFVYDAAGAKYRYTENQLVLVGPDNQFLGVKAENIRVVPIGGE